MYDPFVNLSYSYGSQKCLLLPYHTIQNNMFFIGWFLDVWIITMRMNLPSQIECGCEQHGNGDEHNSAAALPA